MSLYCPQSIFSTWIPFSHALCEFMEASAPPFPLSLLVASLGDFFSMGLLVPGKHSQCNIPGTNINVLLSCKFNAKKVKFCAETQVCFRERQGSQEEMESLWEGALVALCLCTWPSFFFSPCSFVIMFRRRNACLQIVFFSIHPQAAQWSVTGTIRGSIRRSWSSRSSLEAGGNSTMYLWACDVDTVSLPDP